MERSIHWIAQTVIASAVILVAIPAQAENFQSNGYQLRLNARQVEGQVLVEGRVEGGTSCERLRLDIRLRNAGGTSKQLKLKIDNAGDFYSRLVEGRLTVKNAPMAWEIETASARCERL